MNVTPVFVTGQRVWGYHQRESNELLFFLDQSTVRIRGVLVIDLHKHPSTGEYFRIGFDDPEEWISENIPEIYPAEVRHQFYYLLVQAKFFLGNMTCSSKEQDYLKLWLLENISDSR